MGNSTESNNNNEQLCSTSEVDFKYKENTYTVRVIYFFERKKNLILYFREVSKDDSQELEEDFSIAKNTNPFEVARLVAENAFSMIDIAKTDFIEFTFHKMGSLNTFYSFISDYFIFRRPNKVRRFLFTRAIETHFSKNNIAFKKLNSNFIFARYKILH